ncbi:hypothetical protein LTR37_008263 [Vermiconidia calcicola]|uniref:Uncharacterized protein n=1 Tax=Vermiconidia calcicola TaxID=1690605 RepID=A0ACC3NC99_9PEZI|nr:hypothetical protein LTR37_008263 [Vermiconidia calcicola]
MSMEAQDVPSTTGLLSLPVELRISIYEYAFSNVSSRLWIRQYRDHKPMWQQFTPVKSPALLRVSKSIHAEATDALYMVCRPKIEIVMHPHEHVSGHPLDAPSEDCTFRSPRDLSPILQSARYLELEVRVVPDLLWQIECITILRWMRAVVGSRPSEGQESLETWKVVFHGLVMPMPGSGLFEAAAGFECQHSADIFFGTESTEHHYQLLQQERLTMGDWKVLARSEREIDA